MATPTTSGAATPVGSAPTPVADLPAGSASTKVSAAAAGVTQPAKKVVNASTVRVEANFMVSAEDLFGFLTDEARIPQWTRAPAQVSQPIAILSRSPNADIYSLVQA